tara:strand:- start:342 stop:1133 length:792 start_codon:yes stop_codon:yes gene_type:complete
MHSTEIKKVEHGNFSGLAKDYSTYRPTYSKSVLKSLIALLKNSVHECDFADIGAGTGIWTRLVESYNPKSIIAIEPNEDMRSIGIRDSSKTKIKWQKGSGEKTGLESKSMDMVSMASSFHWVDFEKGCKEFHRVLKKNGRFVALWNPRKLQENPFLEKLEGYINLLKPGYKRISSGNSGRAENLTEKFCNSGLFTDVIYIEGRHVVSISPEKYIGAWHSVNDVQHQLGPDKFLDFINHLKQELKGIDTVNVTYQTRAWSALKK